MIQDRHDSQEDHDDEPRFQSGIHSESVLPEISDMLLDLIGAAARLDVLLGELDRSDFRKVIPRLRRFSRLVYGLPRVRPTVRKVGFRVA